MSQHVQDRNFSPLGVRACVRLFPLIFSFRPIYTLPEKRTLFLLALRPSYVRVWAGGYWNRWKQQVCLRGATDMMKWQLKKKKQTIEAKEGQWSKWQSEAWEKSTFQCPGHSFILCIYMHTYLMWCNYMALKFWENSWYQVSTITSK